MAGQLRAPLVTLDPLTDGLPALRSALVTLDPLTDGLPALRSSLVTLDPLTDGIPALRNSLVTLDPLTDGNPFLRLAFLCIESLHPVAADPYMSTAIFPGTAGSPVALPGLAFAVHKRPRFSTIKHATASGVSVRTALMQYPIWEFEVNYEFLEDSSGAASSFKSLLGFYLARQGGFDTFLYKDPDDYLVTNGVLATADGVTTSFPFKRSMGGFAEKVGQVDNGLTITIYGTVAQATTIPAAAGPYTVTVTNAAAFVADLGVTKAGVAMTLVASAPATGQYAVNIATGVYTFAAADQTAAIIITYRYTIAPAAYTVTMPNLLVFGVAPASGTILTADFQFFFACIFKDDKLDFQKFMDKLWSLNTCSFESVPQ